MKIYDIAIIGGGASGVLVANHLLRNDRAETIALFETAEHLGEGVAYSTRRPEHLLNVTAGRMSAFEDAPNHFVDYLNANSEFAESTDHHSRFAERRQFARYLRTTFDELRARSQTSIDLQAEEIVDVDIAENLKLTARSGREFHASRVVLALGNWPRALPVLDRYETNKSRVVRGWDYEGIAAIGIDEKVVIVGSGLSMVDAIVTLGRNGHRGHIDVVSRHGLLPLSHAAHGHLDIDIAALLAMPLRERVRQLRAHAKSAIAAGKPWQWLMDSLRSDNVRLWQTLSTTDQRRFLRHTSRYWDVHRHRIPTSASKIVADLLQRSRMTVHRGRIAAIDFSEGRLDVRVEHHGSHRTIAADRVIDCTGLQPDIRRISHPLIDNLLRYGAIRPGPHGIGIDTDDSGAVLDRAGKASERLYTIGSARIGRQWESVAVPELRKQAAALSAHVSIPMTNRKI